jgi:hypothetical protein
LTWTPSSSGGVAKSDELTLEEAAEPGEYLLRSFNSPKAQGYIEFLRDAFEMNHTHGKYQFAFLAYHMLALVAANRELIARFETKIQATLARVWGEDTG